MSDRKMIGAFMAGLVKRAGGVEAAAAMIGAATGEEPSKGTISKRLAGLLDWPAADIWALEDALGDPCVSRWRMQQLPGAEDEACLVKASVDAVRESNEASTALMEAVVGKGCRTRAKKELSESIAAQKRALSMLEGGHE